MKKTIACLCLMVVLLFGSVQADLKTGNIGIAEPAIPINEETLAAFLDEFILKQMERHNIAGALVAAVNNKEIRYSKGYGYANVEKKRPMDPATSIFRAASVSKLFTAAALVQLAERGKVDLNTDINQYLKNAKIPDTYPQPITISHLLTHTSGFDERFLKVRFDDPKLTTGLYEDVIGSMPPRIRPPGEIVSYSNYGYALAGHIVEAVTEMDFEEYVEQNILRPLHMNHSTFYEPPTENLQKNMVAMYSFRDNKHVELPLAYHNQRPAGALYSNIQDLAHFAIMQLNEGKYGGVSILSKESAKMMQTPQFTHHPKLEGRGYGFYEIKKHGLPIIGHDGDLNGARTLLFLLPNSNIGMVFHFNTSVSTSYEEDPRILLMESFAEKFYPEYSKSRLEAEKESEPSATADLSGYYRFTRYAKESPGKLLNPMILAQLMVKQDKDGQVNISMPMGMVAATNWVPYEEGLFRHKDKDAFLSYKKDSKGRVSYLFLTNGGAMALERIAWYEKYWIIIGLLGFAILSFVITIVYWCVSTFIRWRKGKLARRLSKREGWAKLLTGCNGLIGIVTAGLIMVMILHVMQTLGSPFLFMLPVISLVGWAIGINSIVLLILVIRINISKEIKKRHSIFYILAGIGGLCFTWILLYGNLLWFAVA